MRRRLMLAMLLVLWQGGVLLIGLVLNTYRINQGPTVLVLDSSRGWGLHQMDLLMIGIATLPVLIVGLTAMLAQFVTPRSTDRRR